MQYGSSVKLHSRFYLNLRNSRTVLKLVPYTTSVLLVELTTLLVEEMLLTNVQCGRQSRCALLLRCLQYFYHPPYYVKPTYLEKYVTNITRAVMTHKINYYSPDRIREAASAVALTTTTVVITFRCLLGAEITFPSQ